jgi:ABC-2 type transport system permease protein
MLCRIAGAELRQQYRDGTLRALSIVAVTVLGLTIGARYSTFTKAVTEDHAAAKRVREQWVDQGVKHPHSGAHFGTYAFRHSFAIELLEPGAASYSGKIFPLVTHQRSFPIEVPIDSRSGLTRYGELSPGVVALALLSLTAILLGYGTIASERASGTIRLLMANSASPSAIIWGKCLGLATAIGILWLVIAGVEGAFAALSTRTGQGSHFDTWTRFAAFQGVQLLYAATWVASVVALSAWIRTPRTVLIVALSFWIGNTIVLPRTAATAIRTLIPEPSTEQFGDAIKHDIAFEADGTEWVNSWSKKLIADTLRHYGVERIEDLPVGYAGIMLKGSDAHYEEVFGKHFSRLHTIHRQQEEWMLGMSFLGPWIAARSLLEGFAGTDVTHLANFSDAAERYRRKFVEATNDVAERKGRGTGWELEVGRQFWESVPDFNYAPPPVWSVVVDHALGLAVLFAWLVMAVVLMHRAGSTLERQA